jgi:hypothetical protein
MSPEKKQEYLDYLAMLHDDIERTKQMSHIDDREKEIEIDSINKIIDRLKEILNESQ